CSPDPEQLETTAILFRAREDNQDAFQEKLQEIEAIFGDEELARQLRLLEEFTEKARGSAEATRSSPVIPGASPEEAAAASAAPAESPRWALTIKPQWCRKILDGSKVWEIKGQNCKKHLRERICIAESGSGKLLGEMTVCDSFKITREDLEANRHLHRIDDLSIIKYSNIYAWVIEDVEACQNPDCRFGVTKQNIRGVAYARDHDGIRIVAANR
ncbi:unnamed protein product, partial [Symbiodinium sp. CCMP2456]